jgi:hypothetical protein
MGNNIKLTYFQMYILALTSISKKHVKDKEWLSTRDNGGEREGAKGKDSLSDVTGRLFDTYWVLFPFCCQMTQDENVFVVQG